MKRRLGLISAFIVIIFTVTLILIQQNRMLELEVDEEGFYISLNVDNEKTEIYPWYNEMEDTYYFFLPSCVTRDRVYYNHLRNHQIEIDGLKANIEGYFDWIKNEQHDIKIDEKQYKVVFMKSENIPSLFIETDSGNMEYIHADKNNEEGGRLTIISESGHMQYNGRLDKMSGRGNSTWLPYKKSYSISLKDKAPICGLSSNKSWKLLSLYFEHDKIHSKIILDMAREAGLSYTPEGTWIDLYCNGEYKGLYLLTETVESGLSKNEVLLEKSIPEQTKEEDLLISTKQMGYLFKVEEDNWVSEAEADEIESLMNDIEGMIVRGDEEYKRYIDVDSIAKQFLIDKIVLEADAMCMSTFFVYRDGMIYAGPMWDYDRAMGEIIPDYETTIETNQSGSMSGWYMAFYSEEDFYQEMMNTYRELLPYFEQVLYEDIDKYVEKISASVEMDRILMSNNSTPNETSSYLEYKSYVKYFKYFLANRLNYLNDLWGITDVAFHEPISTGKSHVVAFVKDGVCVEVMRILDGDCVESVPELEDRPYAGWHFGGIRGGQKLGKEYHNLIPIYEDTVLYASKYDS